MLKNVLGICLLSLNGILTTGEEKSPMKWSTNILQDRVSVIALKTIEPGFDLTDNEIKKFKLWPYGVISYYIDEFSFDKVLRDRIRGYLDVFSGVTGVYFLEMPLPPQDAKTRWVMFVNRRGLLGCADHSAVNFTNEGIQKVILGYDCIANGAQLGEVALAIVGVPAQHNAPDRDDYITVQMNKIIPAKQYLFAKLRDSDWLFHDLEYDFSSGSHYHFHKHSIDGSATIVPKRIVDVPVGEGDGLSYTDILKVRMLYNYISKKKYGKSNGPDCDKLFRPGANFDEYHPRKDDVEPRPKPNKYLGLTDDDPPRKPANVDEHKTKNENSEQDHEQYGDENRHEEDEEEHKYEEDGNENKYEEDEHENKQEEDEDENKYEKGENDNKNEEDYDKPNDEEAVSKHEETVMTKTPEKNRSTNRLRGDLLNILSDYDTGDEKHHKRKEQKFIKVGTKITPQLKSAGTKKRGKTK